MLLGSRSIRCAALLAALAGSPVAWTQSVKLNLPLPLSPSRNGGDVTAFVLSPDEERVVYLAREEGDARAELYSLPLDGASPAVKLTGSVPAPETLQSESLQFTADGAEVLFVAFAGEPSQEDGNDVFRLYRVSASGDTGPRLVARIGYEGFHVVGDSVAFLVPDENYEDDLFGVPLDTRTAPVLLAENVELIGTTDKQVVYLQVRAGNPTYELFGIKPDGTGRVRLDGPFVPGGHITGQVQIAPDGSTVAYRADQLTDGQFELFRVPIDGGQPAVRLSGTLPADRDVGPEFVISPDSTRVLFQSNRDAGNVEELYSAPLDASSSPVKVNGSLVPQGQISEARFSSDGTRVLYRADARVARKQQLFSAASDGSGTALLLTPFDAPRDVESFTVAANGRAFFLADLEQNGVEELYSVPMDGSALPVRLSRISTADGDVTTYSVSRDGSRALFFADAEVDQRVDLFAAPADGSAPPSRIDVSGHPLRARLDALGTHVFYTADEHLVGQLDLLRRPADASAASETLNRALSAGDVQGDVTTFDIAPPGERVVYKADQTADDVDELVSVDLARPREHAFLNDPSPRKFIFSFRAIGQRVVYIQDGQADQGLFSVPLDRSQAPVQLGPTSIVYLFRPTSDGQRVVFLSRALPHDSNTPEQLFVAPVDGSTPAVLVSGTPVERGDVDWAFTLTPDGARVVYRADATVDERFELYSAPLDGSSVPSAISGVLVEGGDVLKGHSSDGPLITPDSRFAVYRADAEIDGRAELFRASVDGTQPPVKLSGPIVNGGGVEPRFLLTADGQRAVFVADRLVDQRFELFSSSLDGNALPVRLNGELTPGGDVSRFALTPDGSQVVYLADALKDERQELFVASTLGARGEQRLSATPVEGGSVQDFVIDPGGRFVVYLADQELDERTELYSVPLDGSAAPRRLNAPLPAGSVVASHYLITPDSRGVVYLEAKKVGSEWLGELFHAPIDPRGVVTRLSGPMVPGGGVTFFGLVPGGRGVVYVANQDDVHAYELYLSRLRPLVRSSR
jgi:Tol biopolymer transport system component